MEAVQLFHSLNKEVQSFIASQASSLLGFEADGRWQMMFMVIFSLVALFCVVILLFIRRWKNKEFLPEVKKLVGVGQSRPRFRKRDKVLFYGRKMLRKVKLISGQVKQGKKRKLVLKFAHRILRLRKETERPPILKVREPPDEYLQEEAQDVEFRVPQEAIYLLQSIRVFGDFEKPIFLRLCKHTETVKVPAGSFLFKIGEADENVFIVQSGRVNLFITNADNSTISLKIIKTGDSLISLLSFTDKMTGHGHPYKTVAAKALEDSTVLKLPMAAFQEIFNEYPETLIKVVQIIMVRLQRVTFTALHQYLGLSAELVNPGSQKKKGNGSPMKNKWDLSNQKDEPRGETSLLEPDSMMLFTSSTRKSKSIGELKGQMADSESTVSDARKRHSSGYEKVDDPLLTKSATEAFVQILGLGDDSLLKDKVEIRQVSAGTYLMKEESVIDVALVYLISGILSVSQRMTDMEEEVHMFTAIPGEVVGGLAVLTGEPSFFTICAKHASTVAVIEKNTVYSILREKPTAVLHIANTVVQRLSPFVRQVDFALDWVLVESARAIYRQGDESDCTYIVLSGRLRSVITHSNGKKELVGEYGKGDLVGIVEMVTHTPRSTTVIAVRDSELAKLPEGLFNAIKLRFPVVVTRLINLLGHRIIGNWQTPKLTRPPAPNNYTTVALVPVSEEVPLTAFTYELYHSLTAIGATLRLTSEVVRKQLGVAALEQSQEYRLTSWLAQQEDQHRICLYQCDNSFTTWSQRCVRQADCILIVGLGYKEPTIGKIEQEIERLAIRTMKELVLLHKEGGDRPNNTIEWLNMRSWVSCHHHVQCSKRMFSRRSQFRINELYTKVLMSDANIHSDFSRLARWLTGMSVGLVLGGGGAKGASHVGMIKAIEEAGIPIDMVGGVSIGAFIGALWCMERDVTVVTQKAREWSKKINNWWSLLFDLTYPATSMFTGKAFNRSLHSTFGDTYIEDLWIPYFTVSTDITDSAMRIHRHGVMWRYIRASMSLSGYMPPLCDPTDGHLLLDGGYVNNLPGILWRYVRGSMSIAGIFPPMCDPNDGHLLIDGCYINNVPADVMRNYGARHIFAIDVGSQDDTDLTNYGDSLSGWWLLWKKFYPFTSPVKVPNLPDIQSRLAYVSCVRQLEEVKNSDYCEYIRPPIDKYKTLQFGSFDEIREVGYKHGKEYLEEMMKSGLPPFMKRASIKPCSTSDSLMGAYKFTDLAQMVCNVRKESLVDGESSSSSDDYEDGHGVASGYASEPSVNVLQRSETMRRRGGSLSLSEPEIETESEVDEPVVRPLGKMNSQL